jgi:hypothetical protein
MMPPIPSKVRAEIMNCAVELAIEVNSLSRWANGINEEKGRTGYTVFSLGSG